MQTEASMAVNATWSKQREAKKLKLSYKRQLNENRGKLINLAKIGVNIYFWGNTGKYAT